MRDLENCGCLNCIQARKAKRRTDLETIAFVFMVCALAAFAVVASMHPGRPA